MARFASSRSGVIRMKLREEEIDALSLMEELLESVGGQDGDPAAERLTVAAYPDDAEAQGEYGRLTAGELDRQRRLDREAVFGLLDDARSGPLDLAADQAEAWLMVLNESRLALAARLGIEEESWGRFEKDKGPPAPAQVFLLFLSEVQGGLIDAMADQI